IIFSFLEARKDKLDAIVITGGEPTLQRDLPEFIRKIKNAGFLVKLDSNGTNPGMLQLLIKEKLVDYIAMDIKAPLEKYNKVIHVKIDTNLIKEIIDSIMNSRLNYEFRTTFAKEVLTKTEIILIGKLINGARLYVLQKLIDRGKILNPLFMNSTQNYSDEELKLIKQELLEHVTQCIIR
ncbi:MAG: anaerobic ribonucleoside-triphosphate reductase activating protein, partial [Candidatus Cloacimonas sp. SDB]